MCMAPINDIRGLEGMSYTKNEKALRCRLAGAYRLADLHGWTQGINNHISLRISQVSVTHLRRSSNVTPIGLFIKPLVHKGNHEWAS